MSLEINETAFAGARPVALVAEDQIGLRETTVSMLKLRGISPIPVSSVVQASSAIRGAPAIDVALLDIHLATDQDVYDKGGIEIARLLRLSHQPIKIIGYSGWFREEQLTREELHLFDETRAKGALTSQDHEELWDLTAQFAERSQSEREDLRIRDLNQLRRMYEMEFSSSEILLRLMQDGPPSSRFTADGALGLAGFEIQILQIQISPSASTPILVWRQERRMANAPWINFEVFGHPELYATGDSQELAQRNLTNFCVMLRDDLSKQESLSRDEQNTLQYLQQSID